MIIEYELTELNRRLANLLKLGKIEETDYTGIIPRARVRTGELLTAFLPMLTTRAGNDSTWWPLAIGEQVIILSPSGDTGQGVILGSINQNNYSAIENTESIYKTEFSDGAIIQYNKESQTLDVTLPDGGTINIISTGGVNITGDVSVTGNVSATGDVTDHTRSMQSDREIYNSHNHSGVTSGVASTAIPTQQK